MRAYSERDIDRPHDHDASERVVVIDDPIGRVVERVRAALPGTLVVQARVTQVDGELRVSACYGPVQWGRLDGEGRSRTVIVTGAYDLDEASEALRRGALGYIDMHVSREALGRALSAAMDGEPAFSRRSLASWAVARSRRRPAAGLTERQSQVAELIADGATNKEIASRLQIAIGTVERHVSEVFRRLGVTNRASLVAALRSRTPSDGCD